MDRNYQRSNLRESVDVIILTWNSEKYIEKCIRSVIDDAENSNLDIEIYVIDNGSRDKTLKILNSLQKIYSSLQVIKLDKNYGTTIPRNLAIKGSKGEYILILDSDTEIKEHSIEILLNTLKDKHYAGVGIVAPRLLYPDGSVQRSCKKLPTIIIKILKFIPGRYVRNIAERLELYDSKIYSLQFHEIVDIDYCISACWMVNRKAIEDVGLLDEHIFYAPEDVDYCLRMWLKGWHVVYNPKAEVVHYAQRISHRSFRMTLLHAEGLAYYFCKYHYLFSRNRIYSKIKR